MREWHVKHMEKTIIKYVTGLFFNVSRWEKRQNKRYGRINSVRRQISYDIKQGLQMNKFFWFYKKIRNDSSFSGLQKMMALWND